MKSHEEMTLKPVIECLSRETLVQFVHVCSNESQYLRRRRKDNKLLLPGLRLKITRVRKWLFVLSPQASNRCHSTKGVWVHVQRTKNYLRAKRDIQGASKSLCWGRLTNCTIGVEKELFFLFFFLLSFRIKYLNTQHSWRIRQGAQSPKLHFDECWNNDKSNLTILKVIWKETSWV